MNQLTPYWMLLNNGGMVGLKARRVPGYFDSAIRVPLAGLAGTGVGKEQYIYSPRGSLAFSFTGVDKSEGKYLLIVKNPIGAVNYIEKTKDWLKTVMGGKFSAWVNKGSNKGPKGGGSSGGFASRYDIKPDNKAFNGQTGWGYF